MSVEHRFTSQEYDAETGLYYYHARYYNPALGRFVSADSIVPDPSDPQAFNRYSYVRNNPLRYTDPTGHSWISKGFRRVINSINKAIDGVLNKLNIEVSDTEVRASYNSNGVTTVSTPSGSVSGGGSAPQTQTERSSSVCSGGTCVGRSTTAASGSYGAYSYGETNTTSTLRLYAEAYTSDAAYIAEIYAIPPVGDADITSMFGQRDRMHRKPHTGIDYAVPIGTLVHAPFSGIVTRDTGNRRGFGLTVIIAHEYGTSILGHNSELLVKTGMEVNAGQTVARSGNTGRSSGPHLHWEEHSKGPIWNSKGRINRDNLVNPLDYLK